MKRLFVVLLMLASVIGYSQKNILNNVKDRFIKLQNDSVIKIRPSFGVDMFTIEIQTGNYKFGMIPGIGYGISYKPYMMKKNYLLAVDMYLQGYASNELDYHQGLDYFNIDILPVFSVFNWFGIGYGLRTKIGLEGLPTQYRSIFSFGLRKEF